MYSYSYVGAMILESHESLRLAMAQVLVFEIISIVIFSTEYLYRIGYAVSKRFAGAIGYILVSMELSI